MFAPITLKALKPKPFSESPQTVGEHLKRARVQRGLSQPQVAALIGVDTATILNWEKSRTEPPVLSFPAILRFLGYYPYPEPQTIPERLLFLRRQNGWTIAEAARKLGVDPSTWGDWERGETILLRRHREQVAELLGLAVKAVHQEMSDRWNRAHVREIDQQ